MVYRILIIASFFLAPLFADDDDKRDRNDRDRRKHHHKRGWSHWYNSEEAIKRVLEDLKQKDPEKYESLVTLKKDDPEAYKKEVQTLSKQAMEERLADRAVEMLKRAETAEAEALVKLYEEDKQKFIVEVKKYWEERKRAYYEKIKQQHADRQELKALVELYHETESETELEEIKEKVSTLLNKQFDTEQEEQYKRIKEASQKLEEMEARLKSRDENKAEILKSRLDSLLKDKDYYGCLSAFYSFHLLHENLYGHLVTKELYQYLYPDKWRVTDLFLHQLRLRTCAYQ